MPKQPAGISKSIRLDTVRATLKRWGRLKKTQIDQFVASALQCDSEELARALYRDLEELSDRNEIRVHHFSRDGVEIPDYDPEVHKNTYCEWSLAEKDLRVLGGALLESTGAHLIIPDFCSGAFSVSKTDLAPESTHIQLYCFFDSQSFLLRLDRQELPFTFVIARAPEKPDPAQLLSTAEKRFGRRSGFLLFPSKTLSSFKNDDQAGHLSLELKEGGASVTDQGSKNGTSVQQLTAALAREILLTARQRQDSTVTSFATGNTRQSPPDKLTPGIPLQTKLPARASVTQQFRILVI